MFAGACWQRAALATSKTQHNRGRRCRPAPRALCNWLRSLGGMSLLRRLVYKPVRPQCSYGEWAWCSLSRNLLASRAQYSCSVDGARSLRSVVVSARGYA